MFEISSNFFASTLLLINGHDDVLSAFAKEVNKKYGSWKKIIENLSNDYKNNAINSPITAKTAKRTKKTA
jgi:hypothetical protein